MRMDSKIYRIYSNDRNSGGYHSSICTFNSFSEAQRFVAGRKNVFIEEEDEHPRFQDY